MKLVEHSVSFRVLRIPRRIATCVSLAWLIVIAAGCPEKRSTGPSTASNSDTTPNRVLTLDAPLTAIQPDEFEVNVPRDLPSTELNSWADEMLAEVVDQDVDEQKMRELLVKQVGEPVAERVLRRRFAIRDAVHLRDAYWARAVAQRVARPSQDDVARVVSLFYHVIHNLPLDAATAQSLPLGPYDSMLLGHGSATDRAWAFAVLLKQHRLNSAIVKPASEQTNEQLPTLVGVLIGENVLLFDMTLGLPIPSLSDDVSHPLISQPATLKQVVENDAVLKQLDLEIEVGGEQKTQTLTYPLTSAALKDASLLVIGDSSAWSRRMEGVQNALTGTNNAVVFEPLVSIGPYEGVLEQWQAATNGLVAADKIGIWDLPEERREARENLSNEQAEALLKLKDTFKAPTPMLVTANENAEGKHVLNIEFTPGQGHHLMTRIKHVLGQFDQAIPGYLQIQGWGRMPPTVKGRIEERADGSKVSLPPAPNAIFITPEIEPQVLAIIPPEVRQLHGRAAAEALFWRGCCQMSLEKYATAADDFEDYLTKVAGGSFQTTARYLAGVATALDGRATRAAAFLRRLPKEDPQYWAARYLVRRWTESSKPGERK